MRSHDDVAQQITVEQEAVDALYSRLDAEVSAARAARDHVLATPVDGPQSLYARDVEIDRLTRRVEGLRAAERSLCVGRIDTGTGESVRIGRIGLRSEHGEVLLVDWRADAEGAARCPSGAGAPGWVEHRRCWACAEVQVGQCTVAGAAGEERLRRVSSPGIPCRRSPTRGRTRLASNRCTCTARGRE